MQFEVKYPADPIGSHEAKIKSHPRLYWSKLFKSILFTTVVMCCMHLPFIPGKYTGRTWEDSTWRSNIHKIRNVTVYKLIWWLKQFHSSLSFNIVSIIITKHSNTCTWWGIIFNSSKLWKAWFQDIVCVADIFLPEIKSLSIWVCISEHKNHYIIFYSKNRKITSLFNGKWDKSSKHF